MRLGAALLAAALLAAPSLAPMPAAAQPQRPMVWGDTLVGTLDPHAVFDVPSQFILLNAYDGLYRYQGTELVPWLAEKHSTTPDGLTWEFTLKEGVKFHDGSAMTAADVVYSFHRLLAMNRAPAAAFAPVLKPEGVTAPDARTVRFVLTTAYAPFLSALPLVAIVNQKLVEANAASNDWGAAWLAANDAGSGAYQVDATTYRARTALDLNRFPDHFLGWSHNRRPLEQSRSRPIMETSTRVLALLRGEIDAGDSYLPTDQVERVERNARTRVPEGRDHAGLHHPHEQPQAALRQYRCPALLRPCLQLRGLQHRHPEGPRRPQRRAQPEQPLGQPARPRALCLRPGQGQGALRPGPGRRRAAGPRDRDPYPVRARADRPGGADVPGRPAQGRRDA